MIELKKYIEEEELYIESLKILSETALRIAQRASEVRKASLTSISLSEVSELKPDTVEHLVHTFRAELYKADLSVSQLQDLLTPKAEPATEDEKKDEVSE